MAKVAPQIQEIDGQAFAKVRIPVSVNRRGEWIADGVYSRTSDVARSVCEDFAAEFGLGNVATHFVYALVPLPDDGHVIAGELCDPDSQ